MSDPWLVALNHLAAPSMVLLCFPWAGGGAAGFHALKTAARNDVSLWAVAPPGRQQRLAEPQEDRLERWLDAIERELGNLPDCPLALFGHSFGAMVAFELARRANGSAHIVCVSSRRAPGLPSRTPRLAEAADDELLAWMRRVDGTSQALLEHPEVLEIILPPLRADLRLDARYRPSVDGAIDAPILALAGRDDPILEVDEMAGWKRWTRAGFALHTVPGGHFHPIEHAARVLQLIRRASDDGIGRLIEEDGP